MNTPNAYRRMSSWLLPALGLLVYANALSGPFIYDDIPAIVENNDIRRLWPLWKSPELSDRASLNHRPVARLSLAVNYALDGLEARGYRLLNIAVHIGSALLLAAVVRRSLRGGRQPRLAESADGLALACALLWMVHPLHSQCINYAVQRTELLMAFFYLLTLYCAIRAFGEEAPSSWRTAAVAACLAGMASKEVMASAPVVVLLYDRVFVSSSWRALWARHRGLYAGLAATWVPLAILLWTVPHGDSIGFASQVTPWVYAQQQCLMIVRYLQLLLWPDPLVLDYGFPLRFPPAHVAPYAVVVLGLVAATLVALRRWPALGFLGAWFFLILAPTSSIIPFAGEAGAERRVYLPSAGVVVLLVVAAHLGLVRFAGQRAGRWGVALAVGLTVALGMRTLDRNRDYRSAEAIWLTVVEAVPDNPRAYNSLGAVLAGQGRYDEAIGRYRQALQRYPDYPDAHHNLANALRDQGRTAAAIDHYRRALARDPGMFSAHNNLGLVLQAEGRLQEAGAHFKRASKLKPGSVKALNNLAIVLLQTGQAEEAVEQLRHSLALDPDYAKGHANLGLALRALGDVDGAVRHLRRSLALDPDFVEGHYNLGLALRARGDVEGAVRHLRRCLELAPGFARARADLQALLGAGR